jgi:hypothetical protein
MGVPGAIRIQNVAIHTVADGLSKLSRGSCGDGDAGLRRVYQRITRTGRGDNEKSCRKY